MPSWEMLYFWVLLRIEEVTNVQKIIPTGIPTPIIPKAREARVSL
jgi:hypothetical protein